MRVTNTFTIGDREVAVKEITLQETREWMLKLEATADDPVGSLLFEEFSVRDLAMMTDLTDEAMGAMTHAELRKVFAKCKEMNPDFFAYRTRLYAQARTVAAALQGTQ